MILYLKPYKTTKYTFVCRVVKQKTHLLFDIDGTMILSLDHSAGRTMDKVIYGGQRMYITEDKYYNIQARIKRRSPYIELQHIMDEFDWDSDELYLLFYKQPEIVKHQPKVSNGILKRE